MMPGGYFDYKQYLLSDIHDQLANLIEELNQHDSQFGRKYSDQTVAHLKSTADLVLIVEEAITHADYLLSGDISEGTYLDSIREIQI